MDLFEFFRELFCRIFGLRLRRPAAGSLYISDVPGKRYDASPSPTPSPCSPCVAKRKKAAKKQKQNAPKPGKIYISDTPGRRSNGNKKRQGASPSHAPARAKLGVWEALFGISAGGAVVGHAANCRGSRGIDADEETGFFQNGTRIGGFDGIIGPNSADAVESSKWGGGDEDYSTSGGGSFLDNERDLFQDGIQIGGFDGIIGPDSADMMESSKWGGSDDFSSFSSDDSFSGCGGSDWD